MQGSPLFISVVIPIYNEEENIPELHARLTPVLEQLCSDSGQPRDSYEIIMVDDGSIDRSWSLIKDVHERDGRVKGITFARNFGHHIALTAGLDIARGSAVVLMDGDLQDPPEEIPRLFAQFNTGYDLVYGIRQARNDSLFKKVTSRIFWWMLRRFSGVAIPEGQTMLRVMSRRLVEAMKQMRERARFVHGMMAWVGFNVTTVEVAHAPRTKGRSKYNIPRMFGLAFHAITSFSTVPLRLATYLGLITSLVSMLIGLYFVYLKIAHNIAVLGYASIIVSIFFVGGIQLLVLGIFGEYVGRTYQEVQQRPLYLLKETLF
jgi:dolichol-phosphate mannosyltransferase